MEGYNGIFPRGKGGKIRVLEAGPTLSRDFAFHEFHPLPPPRKRSRFGQREWIGGRRSFAFPPPRLIAARQRHRNYYYFPSRGLNSWEVEATPDSRIALSFLLKLLLFLIIHRLLGKREKYSNSRTYTNSYEAVVKGEKEKEKERERRDMNTFFFFFFFFLFFFSPFSSFPHWSKLLAHERISKAGFQAEKRRKSGLLKSGAFFPPSFSAPPPGKQRATLEVRTQAPVCHVHVYLL